MPNKKTTRQPKPLYRRKPPKNSGADFIHAEPIVPAHFELREDGTIDVAKRDEKRAPVLTFREHCWRPWIFARLGQTVCSKELLLSWRIFNS